MKRLFAFAFVILSGCFSPGEPVELEHATQLECVYTAPRSPCLELYAARASCGDECARDLAIILDPSGRWPDYLEWMARSTWPADLDICALEQSDEVGCIVEIDCEHTSCIEARHVEACTEQVGSQYNDACAYMVGLYAGL